jgi:hypothetical protein
LSARPGTSVSARMGKFTSLMALLEAIAAAIEEEVSGAQERRTVFPVDRPAKTRPS